MYNPTRLEWHLGDEQMEITPQGTVWSCRTASESFDLLFNRLAVALAKSQDHRASCGVFAFGDLDRQGALANGLHGLNPRNTAHGTPPCKRRPALVWRLVNHKYTVVTRLVDKVNKLVMRTWGFLFHTFSLERVGYLLSTLGRPMSREK